MIPTTLCTLHSLFHVPVQGPKSQSVCASANNGRYERYGMRWITFVNSCSEERCCIAEISDDRPSSAVPMCFRHSSDLPAAKILQSAPIFAPMSNLNRASRVIIANCQSNQTAQALLRA